MVSFWSSKRGWGCPGSCVFLTQSAETIEKKGVVLFESAKKCRGVRKQQEVKEIDEVKEVKE